MYVDEKIPFLFFFCVKCRCYLDGVFMSQTRDSTPYGNSDWFIEKQLWVQFAIVGDFSRQTHQLWTPWIAMLLVWVWRWMLLICVYVNIDVRIHTHIQTKSILIDGLVIEACRGWERTLAYTHAHSLTHTRARTLTHTYIHARTQHACICTNACCR